MAALRAWARELRVRLLILWFCRAHPDTPLAAKLLTAFVVAYAFSPIDLIPDFIPLLGYLDDLLIVPAGIYLAFRLLPPHVVAESRLRAEAWLQERHGKPHNYWAAACVVAVWLALAWWAWTAFAPQ